MMMSTKAFLLSAVFVTTVLAQNVSQIFPPTPAGVPIQLTQSGERASWSPDGARIAFMSKSYGDVFEMDLATRELTLLTGYPNAGYLRGQYLPNGDMLLIGARYFDDSFDVLGTRVNDQEFWVLPRGGSEAIALNESVYEGVAISRETNLIAYAQNFQSNPESFANNESAIYTAEITYSDDGIPSLTNKRELRRAVAPNCTLEPQDFRNNDTTLIYNCYPQLHSGYGSEIFSFDLETNTSTPIVANYPNEFNESEGIYPGGRYILVESTRDSGANGTGSAHPIDIWRLDLDDPNHEMVRLTFFAQNPPDKAGNPVVSPDGRTMAVQLGRLGTQAGVGFGIYLIPL